MDGSSTFSSGREWSRSRRPSDKNNDERAPLLNDAQSVHTQGNTVKTVCYTLRSGLLPEARWRKEVEML